MKKIFALFIAFITFSCTNAQKSSFSKEALSETLLATDNGQVPFKNIIKNHKGKILFIDFWATTCGPCVATIKQMKEKRKEYKKKEEGERRGRGERGGVRAYAEETEFEAFYSSIQ